MINKNKIPEDLKLQYGIFIKEYIKIIIDENSTGSDILEMNNQLFQVILHDTNILAKKFKKEMNDNEYLGSIKIKDGEPLPEIFSLADDVYMIVWRKIVSEPDWCELQLKYTDLERNSFLRKAVNRRLISEFNKKHPISKGKNQDRINEESFDACISEKTSDQNDELNKIIAAYEIKCTIIEVVEFICNEVQIPATALIIIFGKIYNIYLALNEGRILKNLKVDVIYKTFYNKILGDILEINKNELKRIINSYPKSIFSGLENNLQKIDTLTGKKYWFSKFLLNKKQITQNVNTYDKNHKIFDKMKQFNY